jgi:F0F1-type ATP synthase assembly protein I
MAEDKKEHRPGPLRRITQGMGRSTTAVAIPYIMLGYPIAGYGIGWFIHKTFHAPAWVPIVVMMLALIEGFREVIRIAMYIQREDEKKEDDPE